MSRKQKLHTQRKKKREQRVPFLQFTQWPQIYALQGLMLDVWAPKRSPGASYSLILNAQSRTHIPCWPAHTSVLYSDIIHSPQAQLLTCANLGDTCHKPWDSVLHPKYFKATTLSDSAALKSFLEFCQGKQQFKSIKQKIGPKKRIF